MNGSSTKIKILDYTKMKINNNIVIKPTEYITIKQQLNQLNIKEVK